MHPSARAPRLPHTPHRPRKGKTTTALLQRLLSPEHQPSRGREAHLRSCYKLETEAVSPTSPPWRARPGSEIRSPGSRRPLLGLGTASRDPTQSRTHRAEEFLEPRRPDSQPRASPGPCGQDSWPSPRLSHPRVTGCLLRQGRRWDPRVFWNIPPALGGRKGPEPFLPPAKIFQSQIKKECKPEAARKPSQMDMVCFREQSKQLPPQPGAAGLQQSPEPVPVGPGAECIPSCPALSVPGAVGSPRRPGRGPALRPDPTVCPGARTPSWEIGRSDR